MSQAWSGGSTRQWRTTRTAVLHRDGWHCQHCGATIHARCSNAGCAGCAHVDHRIPRARGGSDDPMNLIAACQRCNLRRAGEGKRIVPSVRSRQW